jgi:hypothetical protein
MAYSRKVHHKRKTNKRNNKRNNKKNKSIIGGSCGCNRISGGSPYLSDLSPKSYYTYNSSIQNDPNNHQLSTRMAGVDNLRAMSGGRKNRRSRKNKKQKKIGQKGGLSYSDFSIMNPFVPTNDAPSFTNHILSTNQPNPNTPTYSPGIKYYV